MAEAVSSVAAATSSERRGLQRLPAVPGHVPNRVNDLLLLRPEAEPQEEERRSRHVVFFHGDIQVRRGRSS